MLNINTRPIGSDVMVVAIDGRIALGRECQRIEWQVEDLLKQNHRKVIMDLSGVQHVDSTGIGILVMCAGKMKKAGGEMKLAGAQEKVDQLLRLTKLDAIMEFYPSADEAARGFGSAP